MILNIKKIKANYVKAVYDCMNNTSVVCKQNTFDHIRDNETNSIVVRVSHKAKTIVTESYFWFRFDSLGIRRNEIIDSLKIIYKIPDYYNWW